MAWKISTKTPVMQEGDAGTREMTFDIEWDGSIPRTLSHIGLYLSIDNITTDDADGVRFKDTGLSGSTLVVKPAGTKNPSGSVTVIFNGDTAIEDYELFEVEIVSSYWYETDPATGVVDNNPPRVVVGEKAQGIIADDDDPVFANGIDLKYAAQVVEDLADGGKIDTGARDGLLGALEEFGGSGGTGKDDDDKSDEDTDKSEDSGEESGSDAGEPGQADGDDGASSGDEESGGFGSGQYNIGGQIGGDFFDFDGQKDEFGGGLFEKVSDLSLLGFGAVRTAEVLETDTPLLIEPADTVLGTVDPLSGFLGDTEFGLF